MQQPNDESAASVEKQKKPEENTEKVTAEKPPVIPAAPEASPYYDVPKIDAPLSPERVLSAIINVLTQRGVLVKSYLERSEVDALNARNLARWRDRAAQNPNPDAAKEPKPKPEPLPPKHSEGDWWDEQVLLEGWTPRMIPMLHNALDPTKIHQDTLLWWKQCVDEKTGKQAFRYCFYAAPPLSVSELRDKVHRMFVYAYEVERPAIGKKLSELLSRITRMERIVYYDAEGLLGEEQYQLEKEGDWDGEDQKEQQEEEDSYEDPDPIDANTQERRIILRQEARIRVLEEQCSQMDELAKQVMSLQGSLKQVAEKLDAAAAAKSATPAAAASSAAAAAHAANGKKKHVNLDPAQTRREILRKKLEAQKRVQAEQDALKKAQEESGAKKADEIVDDLAGEGDK